MKVINCEKGAVVQSTQGRDKGKFFVVCGVKDNLVYLADGVKRTVENAKSKNVKHVRLLPANIDFAWDGAADCKIARFLKDFAKARN